MRNSLCPPLFVLTAASFWEFPTGLRLYTVEEGARLCGYPSREAFASSIREEIEAKASRQHQININRQETIARRRLVAESSVRRRSSRLSKHTVLSVSVREPISVRSSNRKPSESPLSSLPASPALDPIDITASPFDVDELPFVLPRVNSSVAVVCGFNPFLIIAVFTHIAYSPDYRFIVFASDIRSISFSANGRSCTRCCRGD